jgi:hypothetical protein
MPPRMPAQLIRFPNLTGAGQPIAERVNIHLLDFNFFFNEATLALPTVPLASQRLCLIRFYVENRMENELAFRTGASHWIRGS